MAGITVRLTVTLNLPGGYLNVVSPAIALPDSGDDEDVFKAVDDRVTYPDLRCAFFTFEYATDGVNYNPGYQFVPVASGAHNFCYATTGDLTFSGSPSSNPAPDPDIDLDHDKRRITASEAARWRQLFAKRLVYVEDDVLAFAFEQMQLSAGQFGTYPLVVFCTGSTWSITSGPFGTDIFAQGVDPINSERGIVGRYAHGYGDNVLFYADRDGIYQLRQSPVSEPVSEPVRGLLSLDRLTYLGVIPESSTYGTQLWVSSGMLGHDIGSGLWYTLTRARNGFSKGKDTHGFDDTNVYVENGDPQGSITTKYETSPLHLQWVGDMKRWRWFGVRWRGTVPTSIRLRIFEGAVTFFDGILDGNDITAMTKIMTNCLAISPTVNVELSVNGGFRLDGLDTDVMPHASHRPAIF